MAGVRHIPAPRCVLGEGASFDAETGELTWVDIPASLAFNWAGSLSARDAAQETAFTFRLTDGSRVDGGAQGLVLGDQTLVPPGLTQTEALNDGAVHPSGRMLIIGSRDRMEAAPLGQAWTLTDQGWNRLDQRFTCFNGPVFSLDGNWLFYTESTERVIFRRPVDPVTLRLGAASVFARSAEEAGFPDGAAIDDDNHLWSAHWDGARLTRYRPDGSVERVIPLPMARATSLAFFGPQRNQLAVTTALPDGVDADSLPERNPSGCLLVLSPGVTGPARPRLDAGIIATTGDRDVQTLP
jgi:sugar lactone lactonase YvrE